MAKTKTRFQKLWDNHAGFEYVCDESVFENQCSMRMGAALHSVNVNLNGLSTCADFSRKYNSHAPGHVRSAQDLANRFYHKPKSYGLGAKSFNIYTGSIQSNIAKFKNKNGMVFIMNGWGSVDHIDLWKGDAVSGTLKAGGPDYLKLGEQVWFWQFD